jgi:alpha-L-rhamnosidase
VKEYVSAEGKIAGHTQAAYVLALSAQVLPDELVTVAVNRLVALIEARNYHLSTGFVSTPMLLPVLSENDRDDVAFRLLLQDTLPSWGYMIKQGATTIWERWDGDVEMRRIHGTNATPRTFTHPEIGELVGMNSYNHFSYGSVCEWLYRYLLGIRGDSLNPGFKHVSIEPHIAGDLAHAQGHYDSIRGRFAVAWHKQADTLRTEITIPANTTATIRLPSSEPEADAQKIDAAGAVGNRITIEVGAGTYEFHTSLKSVLNSSQLQS